MKTSDSNCRDVKDRSDKKCCCGGHNSKNNKKNLRHHATKNRLSIRQSRRIVNMSFTELLSISTEADHELMRLADELTECVAT
jgi:hypothetical protein